MLKNNEVNSKSNHYSFFMIGNRIFDFELNPYELSIYFFLVKHADRNNMSCFPSRATIARKCRMTKNTVDKYIKTLSEKGLIEVHHRKRMNNSNSSNLYFVADLTGG